MASAAMVIIVIGACGGSHEPTALPRLAVTFARTPVPIALNGHCWQPEDHGRCADRTSIGSEILARGLDPIRVLPKSQGRIEFDWPPSRVALTAGPDQDHLEPVPTSSDLFQAPAMPGRYAFQLFAHWDAGDASWVFIVTVANP